MNKVYLNIFFMRIAPITTDFKNGYVGLALSTSPTWVSILSNNECPADNPGENR